MRVNKWFFEHVALHNTGHERDEGKEGEKRERETDVKDRKRKVDIVVARSW